MASFSFSDSELADLEFMQAQLTAKATEVRELKAAGTSKDDLKPHLDELKALKKIVDGLIPATEGRERLEVSRTELEDLAKRRFFYIQSYEIYGGVAGLYDMGPPGTALKNNIISEWRKHFVTRESMLELDCSILTPYPVLDASGHVARFVDMLVMDTVTRASYRADHLLEDALEELLLKEKDPARIEKIRTDMEVVDSYGQEELAAKLLEYDVKAPETGNPITEPKPFNLMFGSNIGPGNGQPAFLRPETAQSIFVNAKRIFDYANNVLPVPVAQIGNSYRNEISPRNALLRVREFCQAEIEHFLNPKDKSHTGFAEIKDEVARLFPSENQLGDRQIREMTFGDAVEQGVIDNETLAYYLARTQQFLLGLGIKKEGLRFRQHMPTEMAHYASDCFDAEVLTSYGWVEVAGHADRSCFDLTNHAEATGQRLEVYVRYPEPVEVTELRATVNKGVVGRTFRANAKHVNAAVAGWSQDELTLVNQCLSQDGEFTINSDAGPLVINPEMVAIEEVTELKHGENITPGVVEPSFGIGRVLYCVMEHNFAIRDTEDNRAVLGFPVKIAPVKFGVFPIVNDDAQNALALTVKAFLSDMGIAHKHDPSNATIGRKYARADEIGIPFGVAIDGQTLEDNTVSLRERDSTLQIRLPLDDFYRDAHRISIGHIAWETLVETYGLWSSTD